MGDARDGGGSGDDGLVVNDVAAFPTGTARRAGREDAGGGRASRVGARPGCGLDRRGRVGRAVLRRRVRSGSARARGVVPSHGGGGTRADAQDLALGGRGTGSSGAVAARPRLAGHLARRGAGSVRRVDRARVRAVAQGAAHAARPRSGRERRGGPAARRVRRGAIRRDPARPRRVPRSPSGDRAEPARRVLRRVDDRSDLGLPRHAAESRWLDGRPIDPGDPQFEWMRRFTGVGARTQLQGLGETPATLGRDRPDADARGLRAVGSPSPQSGPSCGESRGEREPRVAHGPTASGVRRVLPSPSPGGKRVEPGSSAPSESARSPGDLGA
jgi:hypothetical protein